MTRNNWVNREIDFEETRRVDRTFYRHFVCDKNFSKSNIISEHIFVILILSLAATQ